MPRARRCSGKLYKTLGVEDNATTSEIKKAYHKKALTCHPDKVPGQEALFKEVQHAYSTLSSEDQRKVYDQLGSKGMQQAQQMPGGAAVATLHPVVVILYPLIWLFIVSCLLGFLGLLVRKIDHGDPGTWSGHVFVPLWVLAAVLGLIGLRLLGILPDVFEKQENDDEKPYRRYQAAGAIIIINVVIACLIASAALVAMALDGNMSWHYAFIPVFILLGIFCLWGLATLDYGTFRRRVALEQGVDPESIAFEDYKFEYIASVCAQIVNLSCRCAFVGLLYVNVVRPANTGRSYFVVIVPILILIGIPVVLGSVLMCLAKTAEFKTKVFAVVSLIFFAALGVITLCLLAWKAEDARQGRPEDGPTLGQCLIIPFIGLGTSCLGAIFMSVAAISQTCCGGDSGADIDEDEQSLNGNTDPSPEGDDGPRSPSQSTTGYNQI